MSSTTNKSWWQLHQFKIMVLVSVVVLCIVSMSPQMEGSYDKNINLAVDPKELPPLIIYPEWRVYSSTEPTERIDQPELVKLNTQPNCSAGEFECRRVLEKLFQREFPKCRPKFLSNEVTGYPLEVDCCNMDMRLGVEYNGIQHYQYTPRFHANELVFQLQQYRDNMKKRLCQENNFTLIIVPYTIPTDEIETFLKMELQNRNFYY